jgi:glycosyltransferase involved in cell wall biosynthesis
MYSDSPLVGGAERSLVNLAMATARVGDVDVVVCSPHGDVLERVASVEGVRTHRIETRSTPLGAVLDHRAAFRAMGIDLLQVTLPNPFAARAAIAGGVLARIPTVAVEQLVRPSERRRGRYLKRAFAAAQAATIAVGERTGDDLHDFFGIPARSIRVAHNGVPDPGLVPLAGRPATGRPVIGCAARLEAQKGIDLLVEALAALDGVELVLVGDGEERGALERQVADLGLDDRVRFVGWVEDAPRWMAGFDAFVLPSRNEAFPLTIAEAMLVGTPVVATDVGSVSEAVVDGETGLLVPPQDVPALTAAIRRVLGDRSLATRLADTARQRAARRYTDDAMASAYAAIWSDVLGSR